MPCGPAANKPVRPSGTDARIYHGGALNVRSGLSFNSQVLGIRYAGDVVIAFGRHETWVRISPGGVDEQWVASCQPSAHGGQKYLLWPLGKLG